VGLKKSRRGALIRGEWSDAKKKACPKRPGDRLTKRPGRGEKLPSAIIHGGRGDQRKSRDNKVIGKKNDVLKEWGGTPRKHVLGREADRGQERGRQ